MWAEQKGKKTGLVAVLAAVVCLSGAAIYHRLTDNNNLISNEVSDGTIQLKAQGYAGFYFVNHPLTWDQAKNWCDDQGMVLATVDEGWKRDKIRSMVGNRAVWIGYRARGGSSITDKRNYRWESGAPTGWAPWAPAEPNNLAGEFCVELVPNGMLNNHQCRSHRLPFVCDKSPYVRGYAMHGVNGPGIGFDEAEAQCRIRYGTSLATLADPDLMAKIMSYYQAPTAWMGLRVVPGYPFNPRYFRFISGAPLRYPLRWAPGEPNNHQGHERCGEIRGNGQLNDLPCNWRLKWYMCDQYRGNTRYSVSGFEWNGFRNPSRNYALPAKVIQYGGRKRYRLSMNIRINGVTSQWGTIVAVGNTDRIRVPSIFGYPSNQRRLHFRQTTATNWNDGCDPTVAQTPPLGRYFRVDLVSYPGRFSVYYNRALRCSRPITMTTVVGSQRVWFGNPWNRVASPVTVEQLRFYAY